MCGVENNIEFLERAKIIRLRTQNGKYLVADDNEKSVSQHRDGSTKRAHWTVDFIGNGDIGQNVVYLKSCYGKYLTASNKPYVHRINGFKVIQTLPQRLDSSHQWEVERDGVHIRLRTRYGRFLRPRKGLPLPLLRNKVTHEIPYRTSSERQLLWQLDVMETNNTNTTRTHHRALSDSEANKGSTPFSCALTVSILDQS